MRAFGRQTSARTLFPRLDLLVHKPVDDVAPSAGRQTRFLLVVRWPVPHVLSCLAHCDSFGGRETEIELTVVVELRIERRLVSDRTSEEDDWAGSHFLVLQVLVCQVPA